MEVIYKHKRAELPPIDPQFAPYEPHAAAAAREVARRTASNRRASCSDAIAELEAAA